eukprot:Gb_15831 [translate_table: standard]
MGPLQNMKPKCSSFLAIEGAWDAMLLLLVQQVIVFLNIYAIIMFATWLSLLYKPPFLCSIMIYCSTADLFCMLLAVALPFPSLLLLWYPPHGPRTVVIEEGVHWDRIRAPPVNTSAHDLHVSDCLDALHPGDHVEVQWRRNREFPYGWWYGIVGHADLCDGDTHHCQCHLDGYPYFKGMSAGYLDTWQQPVRWRIPAAVETDPGKFQEDSRRAQQYRHLDNPYGQSE